MIYDAQGNVLVNATSRLNPTATPIWGDFVIALLDHSFAIEAAAGNNFGNDYLAGGAGNDMIFGQLGNDVIQGDGSVQGSLSGTPVFARRNADGTLSANPSFEAATDGDDYIEGNGGNDVVFGGLGQDDIVGGNSTLFGLTTRTQRPDGSDLIFGGSATRAARNDAGDVSVTGHARDADMILADNGNIYRLVGVNGAAGPLLTFNYDNYSPALKIVVRAAELLDYTPGGVSFNPASAALDIGTADEVHGEAGDDFIYGMAGNDALFGDGQDDDVIGGYGSDWISGGTGQDGALGDDGRILTSRNSTAGEALYGISGIASADLNTAISTPGKMQQAVINVAGALKKTVNLTPFSSDPSWNGSDDEFPTGQGHIYDDVIYGGLGSDFLHGGSGDDAISGAEALPESYVVIIDAAGNPVGLRRSDFDHPFNPGNALGYRASTTTFAQYDAFDPLRKILLNDNGTLSKSGTGKEWFLNFLSSEGPQDARSASTPRKNTDGDDAMFGDNGNDWLMGGTGRDDFYGGWGNDSLYADDDLSTAGTLNNTTDTDASYEDRAYGGAGRDVLLANTGGDRLIDWAGEFNSYLVPFAPFGMATVSRALQPQLQEFLYALSASDGADPTRASDTGAEAVRNGEPQGELGLVLQKDAAWQDQTGSPRDPQPGNIGGGQRDVLRSADFNNGNAQALFADTGAWKVTNGAYQATPSLGQSATSVMQLNEALPGYFEVEATVNTNRSKAGMKADAYIIFDYQSPTEFKFAGVDVGLNKLQIGQRTAGGWTYFAQANMQLSPLKDYNLRLIVNGSSVALFGDETHGVGHTFVGQDLRDGMVGLGTQNSVSRFDNVQVLALPPTALGSFNDDFSSGAASGFTKQIGSWQVNNGRYQGAPLSGSDNAVSTFVVDASGATGITLTSVVATQSFGGLVFDYRDAFNFKFAGINVSTKQVVLGHRTPNGWYFDQVATWSVKAGTDYSLAVQLTGSSASVAVNDQAVLSQSYNSYLLNGRRLGYLSLKGSSSFDDLQTQVTARPVRGPQVAIPVYPNLETRVLTGSFYAK